MKRFLFALAAVAMMGAFVTTPAADAAPWNWAQRQVRKGVRQSQRIVRRNWQYQTYPLRHPYAYYGPPRYFYGGYSTYSYGYPYYTSYGYHGTRGAAYFPYGAVYW